MKNDRTEAIVLGRTNYGEADRIIQLLTPRGKRSVIARGVRREKSKLAGGIELFALSDLVIHSGRGELGIVTSARLIQFYRHILEDYDRMQFGYEVIKQVKRVSELVDEPEWFDTLLQILSSLDSTGVDLLLIKTWWYIRYSSILGHELSLSYDIKGQVIQADSKYRYDSGERGLSVSDHGEIVADHIKLLRLIATKSLKAVAQIGGVQEILPTCFQMAREHAAIES